MIYIRGGRMLLVRRADIGGKTMDIVSLDGRITDIAEHIENYYGIEELDLEGKRVYPSLIDGHVHVTGGGGEMGPTSRVPEIRYEDIIKGGVTTLVGLLGTDAVTRSVENLVSKVKALNEYNVRAYALTGAYDYPSRTITGSVKKDITYISEIIGCKLAISDHRSSYVNEDELARLAGECYLGGLFAGKVGELHMHTGGMGKEGLSNVFKVLEEHEVPIKVFRPTHCKNIVDDAVKFMHMGGYADFTAGEDGLDAIDYAIKNAPFERITLSSDSNGSVPIWSEEKELLGIGAAKISSLFETIKLLIKNYGYELGDMIKLASTNAAKALEIDHITGDIKKGLSMDIMALDEDGDIDVVISKGVVEMKDKKVLRRTNFSDF